MADGDQWHVSYTRAPFAARESFRISLLHVSEESESLDTGRDGRPCCPHSDMQHVQVLLDPPNRPTAEIVLDERVF